MVFWTLVDDTSLSSLHERRLYACTQVNVGASNPTLRILLRPRRFPLCMPGEGSMEKKKNLAWPTQPGSGALKLRPTGDRSSCIDDELPAGVRVPS